MENSQVFIMKMMEQIESYYDLCFLVKSYNVMGIWCFVIKYSKFDGLYLRFSEKHWCLLGNTRNREKEMVRLVMG